MYLQSSNHHLARHACSSLGEIVRSSALPLPSTVMEEESGKVLTKLSVVEALRKVLKNTTDAQVQSHLGKRLTWQCCHVFWEEGWGNEAYVRQTLGERERERGGGERKRERERERERGRETERDRERESVLDSFRVMLELFYNSILFVAYAILISLVCLTTA